MIFSRNQPKNSPNGTATSAETIFCRSDTTKTLDLSPVSGYNPTKMPQTTGSKTPMADFFAKMLGIEAVDLGPMQKATHKAVGATDTDAFLSQIALSDPKLFQALYMTRQQGAPKPAPVVAKPAATGPLDRIRALIQGFSGQTPPGRAASILDSAAK
jgi:hypothetical protein